MLDERRQILDMLAEKKISVDEAERLLAALGDTEESGKRESGQSSIMIKANPKFLKIRVTPKNKQGNHVNIKVPLALIKAGVKIGSIIPSEAKAKINSALGEKGLDFDLNKMDANALDNMLKALTEMSIDVDDEDESVKIFCE